MSLIFKQLFERESCTYTYLIADSLTKEAAIIDAVDIMIERDTALLKELELDLKFIIETHIHADHITSACPLKKYYTNARIVLGMKNIDAEACPDILVSEGIVSRYKTDEGEWDICSAGVMSNICPKCGFKDGEICG